MFFLYLFLGKKGAAPGEAIELTSDGTASPPKEQLLTLTGNVITTSTSGSIETRRIGPAKSWNSLYYEIIDDSNDDMQVEIVGITKGKEGTGGFDQFKEGPIRQELTNLAQKGNKFFKPEEVIEALKKFTGEEGNAAIEAAVCAAIESGEWQGEGSA